MLNKVELIHEWILKADHDLGTAKLIYLHIPEYTDTIGFHCQQAIEKYLKGYLVYLDIEFKFVHDLIYLLDLISKQDEFEPEFYEMASSVEDFSVEVRYPGGSYNIESHEIKNAIEYVEKFREIIMNRLKSILNFK